MKKITTILTLLVISCQLSVVTPALAQTATSSPQSIRDRLQNLKEERQGKIAEIKDDAKERMDAFKAQIRTIKDTRKQMLTERITDKIATSNARLTNKMDNALGHLTDILNRVKNRSAAFKVEGKDTTALDQAISAAEAAIAAAQAAVDAQSSKEYTATIVDEPTLRNTIGQMVSQFRKDISAVHKLLVDAKQAVQKAISEAAKLRGEDNTATGSASI